MKIHLVLEPHDVKDMLTQYFNTQGFDVKNLAQLCEAFEAVFPQGIDVEASPCATVVQAPVAAAAVEHIITSKDAVDTTAEVPSTNKRNPRLGLSDLMDPTTHGSVPTRDELLEETSRELQEILNASKSLEFKSTRKS